VAGRVAVLDAAALPRRQCIPPCSSIVASHIQLFGCFAKFSQKLNWSQIFTKMKVVRNFESYKTSFGVQN